MNAQREQRPVWVSTVNFARLLLILAVVCFLVAWWIATGNSDSWTNPAPWGYAGLALFAASFLP